MPDTFIVNEKAAKYHEFTVKNQMTRIGSDGEINRSVRYYSNEEEFFV